MTTHALHHPPERSELARRLVVGALSAAISCCCSTWGLGTGIGLATSPGAGRLPPLARGAAVSALAYAALALGLSARDVLK
jgi:hypothetical protein